ncbi:MAG TPA: hypothetical protein VGH29_13140 [Candidatus Binataceae bacterium]
MNSADRSPAVSPLCGELDAYHDQAFNSAAMNMAIDEALLEIADRPSIRFYRWDHRALSLGYFGKFAEVKDLAMNFPTISTSARRLRGAPGEDGAEPSKIATPGDIVRRWTGGGMVLHGQDLTYALVIPSSAGRDAPSSRFVYAAVHEAIREALRCGGHAAELALTDATANSEACFERPVVADVMVSGRKVAGAAHRRTRRGLLHQGSIQNINIVDKLASSIAGQLSAKVEEQILDEVIMSRATQIAQSKYSTPEWLHRW